MMMSWSKLKKTLASLLLVAVSGGAFAVGQAWIDGQQSAKDSLGAHAGNITNSNVSNLGATNADPNVPTNLGATFGASNAGNVGLTTYGDTKKTDCAGYVDSPTNQALNQECAAVNALAKNPVQKAKAQTGITSSDPIFTNPNNMFNQGYANAGSTGTAIGGGTSQNGTTGGGACVTTTSTTGATYSTQTCTRAALPIDKTCAKVLVPTVTSTKVCNISGSVYTSETPDTHNVNGPSFGRSKNIVNSSYRLTFSCHPTAEGVGMVEFGPNAIFPDSPRGPYNVVWWANGSWGVHWQTTKTVSFTPGTAATYGPYKMMQGSGSCGQPYGRDHYLYYDGQDFYVYETGNAFDFCFLPGGSNLWWEHDDFGFCAPGYTYVSGKVVATKCGGSRRSCEDYQPTYYRLPAYCTSASDPAIVPTATNTCPAGTTPYNPLNIVGEGCIKSFNHYYPPDVNPPIDRGMRHFAKWSGTYNGYVGIQNVLSETFNDSCQQYQSVTPNPAGEIPTSVAGVLTCSAGKTLAADGYCK